MKNTFFTADTHFGHANVIKYCSRPFKTAKEMDEAMIANWNSVVGQYDTVYHLGDFSFWKGDRNPPSWYRQRLNGHIFLIRGNHDRDIHQFKTSFDAIYDGHRQITVDGQDIVLCHYAMRVWNKSHHGVWHLYGHSHGTLADDPHSRSFDVGVDCHGFTPISFQQVSERMAKKKFKPVDHHGPRR